jgi:molybdopterin synthase sulfur carrier subunit
VARVRLSSSLAPYTGGHSEFEVEAANVRQLLERLAAAHPELAPHLEHGIAVAIDGVIYQDAWLQPIGSASEVVVIERIAGG